MHRFLFAVVIALSLSSTSESGTSLKPAQQASLVLASREVIGPNRLPVGFAYREKSDNEYSGWVFLSGHESQEYLDDSSNLALSPLDLFLEMDPSLAEIIDRPVGTYWKRDNNPKSRWSQIVDHPDAP